MLKYSNPWIPAGAIEVLEGERGTILDVGGGVAPYFRATHVIDIQPFSAERLMLNAWGAPQGGAEEGTTMTQRHEEGGGKTTDGRLKTADQGEALADPPSLELPPSLKLRWTSRRTWARRVQGINEEPRIKNEEHRWHSDNYTQLDLCSGERWPFTDKAFDLGLSSHCLEDIRDPIQVVKEMARCCRRTLIICPSRLMEQMRGVDHPRYCGMPHHLWLVYEERGELVFRRKTPLVEFPGLHLVCPKGKKLTAEAGSMFYLSESPVAKEAMYFDTEEDRNEYAGFVKQHADVSGRLEADSQWRSWRKWVWYWRQKYRYAV